MKNRLWKGLAAALLFLGQGFMLAQAPAGGDPPNLKEEESGTPVSHEIDADYGYVAGARAHLGSTNFGQITEQSGKFEYVASTQLEQGRLFRFGIDWQGFSFGIPRDAPLPNTLESVSLVLGGDIQLTDEWLMRAEIEPGIYSDMQDVSFSDVNVPVIVGFSYLANKNLQWFFGISGNAKRDIPLLPAAGVRWKFAEQWTWMLLLPKPRLEFQPSKNWTWFVGAGIDAGTYTVARDFGNQFGRQDLNHASLDYTEIRAGTGFSYKIRPGFTLEVEGGYMGYREFNFHDSKTRIVNNDGAPYGEVALHVDF